MGISPIALYIYKRKVSFILELLKNRATNELVSRGTHETVKDVICSLGIEEGDVLRGRDNYRNLIGMVCINKLKSIKNIENDIKESPLVLAVEYLLNHRSMDNDDTLQYLLDPRRGKRGWKGLMLLKELFSPCNIPKL
jgi:hypothetical protein